MGSNMRVHGRLLSTYMYGYTRVDFCTLPGRCTERPRAIFVDTYSWKLTYSELMP